MVASGVESRCEARRPRSPPRRRCAQRDGERDEEGAGGRQLQAGLRRGPPSDHRAHPAGAGRSQQNEAELGEQDAAAVRGERAPVEVAVLRRGAGAAARRARGAGRLLPAGCARGCQRRRGPSPTSQTAAPDEQRCARATAQRLGRARRTSGLAERAAAVAPSANSEAARAAAAPPHPSAAA